MPRRKPLDPPILQAALAGLEARRQRIDDQIATVRSMIGGQAAGKPAPAGIAPKKRTLSAAARKRIAVAQRRRWRALKKAKKQSAPKKRRLSAEGRRNIIEATRKRWAEFRAKKAAQAAKATAKKARKPAAKKAAKPSTQPAAAE